MAGLGPFSFDTCLGKIYDKGVDSLCLSPHPAIFIFSSQINLPLPHITPYLYQAQQRSKPQAAMPRLPIDVLKKKVAAAERAAASQRDIKATRLRSSSQDSLVSTPPPSEPEREPDPLELVYNIRHGTLRQAPRSTVLKQDLSATPLIDLPVHGPPLLVDGRMQIVEIPRWKMEVGFFWRTWNGDETAVLWRKVRLPLKIWMQRNFGEERKWKTLWIERS
jgi:hypothetical protein